MQKCDAYVVILYLVDFVSLSPSYSIASWEGLGNEDVLCNYWWMVQVYI